ADLRTGDIVVHEDHGVARFAGFETRTVAAVTRDYLYLEYAGSDRVFVPVDQLAKISRDVGYGKTEVALRAAFKAVQDGKQVMVLAPTTILAQQHFGTFSERLKD